MNKVLKVIIGLIISIVLLYLLLFNIELEVISNYLADISFEIIIVGFFIYLFMNLFRAARLKVLFPDISVKDILRITFIHNFFNNLLPVRTGELSHIYLIKKKKSYAHGVSSLFFLRFLDLLTVAIIFVVALLFSQFVVSDFYTYIIWLIVLLAVILLAYIIFVNVNIKHKFVSKVQKTIKEYSYKKIFLALFSTVGVWIFSFLLYYIIVQDLSMNLSYFDIVIPTCLLILSTVLPISGLAGFGTMEGAWTLGLLYLGIPKAEGVSSGLIIHILRIVYVVILGGIGFLISKTDKNKRKILNRK